MSEHVPDVKRRQTRLWPRLAMLLLVVVVMGVVGGIMEYGGRAAMRKKMGQLLVSFPTMGWTELHQYDPDLMWSMKPNVKNAYQVMRADNPVPSHVNTNELGLRGPSIAPKNNRFRILCIGGSTTFGAGVGDAQTWPAQLQAILDKVEPGRYDVINAGVSAYSSWQGMRYLELRGFALEPDLVIASWGHNEHGLIPENGVRDMEWERPPASGFVALVKEAMKGAGIYKTHASISERNRRVSDSEFVDTLFHTQELCAARKVFLAFLVWPSKDELDKPATMPPPSLIRAIANEAMVQCIDLTDMIKGAGEDLYIDGLHMTPEGNRRAAAFIGKALHFVPEGWTLQ